MHAHWVDRLTRFDLNTSVLVWCVCADCSSRVYYFSERMTQPAADAKSIARVYRCQGVSFFKIYLVIDTYEVRRTKKNVETPTLQYQVPGIGLGPRIGYRSSDGCPFPAIDRLSDGSCRCRIVSSMGAGLAVALFREGGRVSSSDFVASNSVVAVVARNGDEN